jgi:hypothetical protein
LGNVKDDSTGFVLHSLSQPMRMALAALGQFFQRQAAPGWYSSHSGRNSSGGTPTTVHCGGQPERQGGRSLGAHNDASLRPHRRVYANQLCHNNICGRPPSWSAELRPLGCDSAAWTSWSSQNKSGALQ